MKLGVTNEELMTRYAEGDCSAQDALCEQNRGLIHDRAERIAFLYNCYRFNDRGNPTAYTIELLSDLESEGMAAFIECTCGGGYIPSGNADHLCRAVYRRRHAAISGIQHGHTGH